MVATIPKRKAPRESVMGRRLSEPDLSTYRGRFAARLRELRQKKFATQREFADALLLHGLEVSLIAISTWERGERCPDVAVFPAIAAALDVAPRLLLPLE